MNAFYFPFAVTPCNQRIVIQSLMGYCGVKVDTELMDSFEWKVRYKSDRDRSLEVPDEIKTQLEFAMEWHKHYTLFWGAKLRHPENMLGEGK